MSWVHNFHCLLMTWFGRETASWLCHCCQKKSEIHKQRERKVARNLSLACKRQYYWKATNNVKLKDNLYYKWKSKNLFRQMICGAKLKTYSVSLSRSSSPTWLLILNFASLPSLKHDMLLDKNHAMKVGQSWSNCNIKSKILTQLRIFYIHWSWNINKLKHFWIFDIVLCTCISALLSTQCCGACLHHFKPSTSPWQIDLLIAGLCLFSIIVKSEALLIKLLLRIPKTFDYKFNSNYCCLLIVLLFGL